MMGYNHLATYRPPAYIAGRLARSAERKCPLDSRRDATSKKLGNGESANGLMHLLPPDFPTLDSNEIRSLVLEHMAELIVGNDPDLISAMEGIPRLNPDVHASACDLDWFRSSDFCGELNLLTVISGFSRASEVAQIADLQSSRQQNHFAILLILGLLGATQVELKAKGIRHVVTDQEDDAVEISFSVDLEDKTSATRRDKIKVPLTLVSALRKRLRASALDRDAQGEGVAGSEKLQGSKPHANLVDECEPPSANSTQ